MRLTIEGTDEQKGRVATISFEGDEWTLPDLKGDLEALLIAWGYAPETVANLLNSVSPHD